MSITWLRRTQPNARKPRLEPAQQFDLIAAVDRIHAPFSRHQIARLPIDGAQEAAAHPNHLYFYCGGRHVGMKSQFTWYS